MNVPPLPSSFRTRLAARAGLLAAPLAAFLALGPAVAGPAGTPTVEFTSAAQGDAENAGPLTATLQLSQVLLVDVDVPFSVGGTALDGLDYTVDASPATILAGQTTVDVTITLLDDPLDEDDETVVLTLGAPTNADLGVTIVHTATVQDEDAAPSLQFQVPAQPASEGDGATAVTVDLSAVSGLEVSVPFTVAGTATDPADYTIDASPLVIPAGQASADVTITWAQDALDEADETVELTLGAPTNATLGGTTVHTTTAQDDDPPPTVNFDLLRQQKNESFGQLAVSLSLSEVSGQDVSVPFTLHGKAKDGLDYNVPASPLVIAAGSLGGDLVFQLLDDFITEGPERFVVKLQAPTNAILGSIVMHGVTILDNDGVTWSPQIKALTVTQANLTFPTLRVGETGGPELIVVRNPNSVPVDLKGGAFRGDARNEFRAEPQAPGPVTIPAGGAAALDVFFEPLEQGVREATLRIQQSPRPANPTEISVSALAFGRLGEEMLMTSSADDYVDSQFEHWSSDHSDTGFSFFGTTPGAVGGTLDDGLYQSWRAGASFGYSFELPNGTYDMVLHFVEPTKNQPGQRVFDVNVEGVLVLDEFDAFVAAGGKLIAYEYPLQTTVLDGTLDVDLSVSVFNALICAVEARSVATLTTNPVTLDYGVIEQGQFLELPVSVINGGVGDALVSQVSFILAPGNSEGSGQDFSVEIDAQMLVGGSKSVAYGLEHVVPAGGQSDLMVRFAPTEHEDHQLSLRFEGNFEPVEVTLVGHGGANADWGFLHPVISSEVPLIVDYDGDSLENVKLFGEESHTHEPGHIIVGFQWDENQSTFSTVRNPRRDFNLGDTAIELTISDDNNPGNVATVGETISVYPADGVPGILAQYYDAMGSNPVTLLDAIPASVDFIERVSGLQVINELGTVGGSPYNAAVMLQLIADFDAPQAGSYEFTATGGVDHRIEVDSAPVAGPVALAAGTHNLEVRFAIDNLSDLPVTVTVDIDGQPAVGFDGMLTHDENGIPPVIHDMPTTGIDLGGNTITIQGFGFYPQDQVTVHWGGQDFDVNSVDKLQAELIEFVSPPGAGPIQVTVETPSGTSNAVTFMYSPSGPVPINFNTAPDVPAGGVTSGAWGPDGRFYVGQINGEIKAITFDENYIATNVGTYVGVSNLSNENILGITFNPFDPPPPAPVRVYIGHGEHFLNGGSTFAGPSPYTGQITVLEGPNFDYSENPQPLITRLPTSNHDHAINGLQFDNNGDLLIAVGSNTNAGVKWPNIGDLHESPLSAAILKAETSRLDFDGALTYVETQTQIENNDQVDGDIVDVAPGTHVTVHASGTRNPYDIVLTTWGMLYATDNGPNGGFGPASTGPNTQTQSHPGTSDELLLIEYGNYYGHPNRNRGRYDFPQNIYRNVSEPSIPGEFVQRIDNLPSSTNGIAEYRADTFNGQIRDQLLVQKWNHRPKRIELTADKRNVVDDDDIFPHVNGLDVATGPGGAILTMDYSGNDVHILVPDDAAAVGLTVYDIFPWRAPATGGAPFVIGGDGFGTLGNTSVTIGGLPATLTSVSSKRIVGVVPANGSPTADLLDVTVTVALDVDVLTGGFRFLFSPPGVEPGIWTSAAPMPDDLGEVAAGVIDGVIYVVGEGNSKTYAYDIASNTWGDNLAIRPFTGNHHGAEVVDGKWYLVGGLSAGQGQVQIYDPQLDSWSTGAPMSWSGGSVSTCVIDGLIYAAGGIVGSSTVVNAATYDPVGDSWSALPNMHTGVNHAASATDGARFFIFGGRAGGNVPQVGFDTVQIYDPMGGAWDSSDDGGSSLSPMIAGRGGTGRAVYYQGEFYVMGGETSDGGDPLASPGQVFKQIYVYDPVGNSWREDAWLPTPRHGIYPVLYQSRMFVPGGGVTFGNSQSDVHEVFTRQ